MTTTATLAASQAELDCRAFAAQFNTPNVREAIRLCESGRGSWVKCAAMFRRILADALEQVNA